MIRKLWARRRIGRAALLVSDGRVGCPLSSGGETSVDTCLSCTHLQDVRVDEDGRSWVRCHPVTHSDGVFSQGVRTI